MGTTIDQGRLLLSWMHSDGLAGREETFVRYGVTSRLEIGVGFLARQQVFRPLASYVLVPERFSRPSLTAGLMYDSLGGGRQGAFLSFGKAFAVPWGGLAGGYVGGAKISNEEKARFIAGVNLPLGRRLNASLQYDGRYSNVGVTVEVVRLGDAPVRVGLVGAKGRYGPLVAVRTPLAY